MTDKTASVSPNLECAQRGDGGEIASRDELRTALATLTDRAEAGGVLTGDEADEYRKLTERTVSLGLESEDEPEWDSLDSNAYQQRHGGEEGDDL
jgi:hypothetical protein